NAVSSAQCHGEGPGQAQRRSARADRGRLWPEALDMALVAQRVSDSVRPLLGVHSSSLYRIDPESGALVAFAVSGWQGVAVGRDTVFPRGHAVIGVAVRGRAPVAAPGLLPEARLALPQEIAPGLRALGN